MRENKRKIIVMIKEEYKGLLIFLKKSKGGMVTIKNTWAMSNGISALILVNGTTTKKFDLQIFTKIYRYIDATQALEFFMTLPIIDITKTIYLAWIDQSQVDFYKINEISCVILVANQQILNI